MPSDVLILLATAVLAVVAVAAAVISVRNVRELRRRLDNHTPAQQAAPAAVPAEAQVVHLPAPLDSCATNEVARVVEGRVVVTPTRQQVAAAVMGQPRVRVALWFTGLAHALRPESRDRIVGMMRRDYRERRRFRDRAARRAARSAHNPAAAGDDWVGS